MKAVIYARYSSDSQREESIEGQIRECKEYAERSGITIVGTYIDRALSAKTDNRPEFQRMIKDSAKRLFEVVLRNPFRICAWRRAETCHRPADGSAGTGDFRPICRGRNGTRHCGISQRARLAVKAQ